MGIEKILKSLRSKNWIVIDERDLESLLAASKQVREERPGGGGPIRVLVTGDDVLVQETSDKGEVVIRRFDSEEDASRFVSDRLDTYDRMWDGCGCRIDYYE